MTEALWALGRGTGVVALVMFTIAVALGVASGAGRAVPGLGRSGATDLHRTAALTGTGLVLVHVGSLLFDPYAQLHWVDFFVPFLGEYRPVWLGLGTLALDLLLVITVVSLLRHRVGPRVFRTVHAATYVLWPISLGHAVGNGTDRTSVWFLVLAGACVGLFLLALSWRLAPSYAVRGRERVLRRVAADPASGRPEKVLR